MAIPPLLCQVNHGHRVDLDIKGGRFNLTERLLYLVRPKVNTVSLVKKKVALMY